MKKILTITSLAFLAATLVSCGGNGYPKMEKKAAKKTCACYKKAAEYHLKKANYEDKNKEAIKDPNSKVASEVVSKMETHLTNLKAEAATICYEGWEREREEYINSSIKSEAVRSICPEIYYSVIGGTRNTDVPTVPSDDNEGSNGGGDNKSMRDGSNGPVKDGPNSNQDRDRTKDNSPQKAADKKNNDAGATKAEAPRAAESKRGADRNEARDMPRAPRYGGEN